VTNTYLEPHQVTLLEMSASNLRDRLLIRILFHLGCRISEALALKIEDIDFDKAVITIIHLKRSLKISCSRCGAKLGVSHSYCPKCGSKLEESQIEELQHRRQRILPIDQETLKMFREYIKRGGPVVKDGKRYIFNINRHRAWQVVKELAEKAGLPKLINPETGKFHNVSPHKLRDAFAINAMKHDDSGDGLRLLQEHLGHQSFNTTAKYRKISGKEHRDWFRKLWGEDKP
jgi:integrase/recombinase XerD